MNTIYVSFPVPSPMSYSGGNRASWAQITYFVYNALTERYPGKVRYIQWTKDIPMTKDDILISCVPNDQLRKFPNRTIIIDNDNFEVNKWKFGRFKKYGLDAETDHTFPFNHCMEGLYGAIFKTNDIAINKWNNNNEDVLEKKLYLQSIIQNVVPTPHPIDKDYFTKLYSPDFKIQNMKMLVYNVPWRKNATQLVEMLKKNFSTNSFSVVDSIVKVDSIVRNLLSEYAYFAHTSYSEGFPYLANEFLCQGLILFGHEEWWEPYGYDLLKWSYNPDLQERNLSNLRTLLSNDFKEQYYLMRKDLVQKHLDRKNNDWSFLCGKLFELIDGLN